MKKNEELQQEIIEVIKQREIDNVEKIKVFVEEDGIVLLTGIVDSYTKKLELTNTATNVAGVKAVKDKIIIQFNTNLSKSSAYNSL